MNQFWLIATGFGCVFFNLKEVLEEYRIEDVSSLAYLLKRKLLQNREVILPEDTTLGPFFLLRAYSNPLLFSKSCLAEAEGLQRSLPAFYSMYGIKSISFRETIFTLSSASLVYNTPYSSQMASPRTGLPKSSPNKHTENWILP